MHPIQGTAHFVAAASVTRPYAPSSYIKGQDTAARYGGEEFAAILPETALNVAPPTTGASPVFLAASTRIIEAMVGAGLPER